jgi:uncharacterized repeat protein (TIGR01451 family)
MANLAAANPPTIVKAFDATTVPLNGSAGLSFTLTNTDATLAVNGLAFTDNLPTGLTVSTPGNLTSTCNGTATAADGSSTVSLAGASLAAGASCVVSVSVTGTTAGSKDNSVTITSADAGTGNTSNASLAVVAPPTTTKTFNPTGMAPNGTSTLSITITNPAANTVALTGVGFTDNFPANLVVATPSGLSNTCGGAATADAGTTSATLTGGTIAVNSSCTVSVNVTSAFAGSYPNSTGPISSDNGGSGDAASATLSVALPPTISKLFSPDTITVNDQTLLSFTINNPNSDPNTNITLTGIQFVDMLPAGVVVASPNQLSNNCGGAVVATPGSSSISLSGGELGPAVGLRPQPKAPIRSQATAPVRLQPAASGSCFVSVEVQATTAGTKNNTSGPISANESGPGAPSNTATLTVNAAPQVQPPTIAKAFGDATIPVNGATSLTFTFTNPNASTELLNVSMSDTLPSGLIVATPNGLTGTCNGAFSANPGGNTISVNSLDLPANSNCSFSVNVTGTSAGNKLNTTSPVTAIYDSGSGTSFPMVTGGTASASIVVVAPPSISKSFNPAMISPNGISTLTFTITNPAINPVPENGVAFTDTLPTNVVVAIPNGATNTCGGTLTAVSGSNSISLTGGTVAVSSSCTVSVNVTSAVSGVYTNTTGPVSSTNGGTGNTASATLQVNHAILRIKKTHNDDFERGEHGTYTITVSNDPTAGSTIGTVTVVDTLPNVKHTLVPIAISGVGWTCNLATLTCTRSDVLAPGASYPPIMLTVKVPKNIKKHFTNSATVSGGGDPNSHTANDPTRVEGGDDEGDHEGDHIGEHDHNQDHEHDSGNR